MKELGFDNFFESQISDKSLFVGRVCFQTKDLYKVLTDNGEVFAEVSGKFRYEAKNHADFPVVGDFVLMDRNSNDSGNAIIHQVLNRKSAFVRKAAGSIESKQIIAANIDKVFICMSLNNDFNLRRLERYLSIAWESGAIPVVVLTKSDLCENLNKKLREAESVTIGTEVIITSSIIENGLEKIKEQIKSAQTIAFIGSSGVGKSTLINKLIGQNKIATKEIGWEDKGRHTTTTRELILLSGGGIVIDTPGMREIGLLYADTAKAFSDIEELSSNCKYHNCTHTTESNCAIQKAISMGELTLERLESYRKLQNETKYDGLTSREIEHKKNEKMYSSFGGIKNARNFVKNKHRDRK